MSRLDMFINSKILFIVTIALFVSKASYGQNDFSYSIINDLTSKQKLIESVDSVSFFTNMSPYEKIFNRKDKHKKEIIDYHTWTIKDLLKDTLQQYQKLITKHRVKKSFVNWDKDKLIYKHTETQINRPNDSFFYYSCPIVLDKNLFVLISFFNTKGGGVTGYLIEYDEKNKSFKKLKLHTVMRYGLMFR